MPDIEEEVERFWRQRYLVGFLDKDPNQYAATFGRPCLIRAEGMPRTVFTTEEGLLAYCAEMTAKAKVTTWKTSTIDSRKVRALDEEVAQSDVEASRFDAAGRKISRLYGRCTVKKEAGQWKRVAIYGEFLRS